MQGGELSREVPITPGATALLIVDIQTDFCRPDGGQYAALSPAEIERGCGVFFRQLAEVTLPAIRRLQEACRARDIEVIFTVIESLTRDGRDRSLDYKITGFNVPRGSRDAQVLEEIAPAEDEIVLPKTSSSVFISTNLDYLLRNLGVRHLIIAGCLTDQCVESAVRDACDLGYLVTLVTDGCTSMTPERHENSLRTIKGYCRQRDSHQLLAEIAAR